MKFFDCNLYKDWIYLRIGKLLRLNISNPFRIRRKLKNVFIPLKRTFVHGRYGGGFNLYLLHKNDFWIDIEVHDVGWKDKYNSPRYENSPIIAFCLLGYVIGWTWKLEDKEDSSNYWTTSDYWEQALWYIYYSQCDIKKAKKTWPWQDMKGNTTWNGNFLV